MSRFSPAPFVLERDDPNYPARLRQLADAPERVYLRGPACFHSPIVAIVGSRKASIDGVSRARRLARELAQAGVTIVSGGALGIDAAAHQGALDARRPTLVVLPTGIERPGPRANLRMFRRVIEGGGAWLSESLDAEPQRHFFLHRNRLVAALADMVLVIEARDRSGTRHTVEAAQKLGRTVKFLSWPGEDPRGEGARAEWAKNAACIEQAEDLYAELGLCAPETNAPDDDLLAALSAPIGIEALALHTGRSITAVLTALTELELNGRVRAVPGGRFERR